MEDKSTIQKKVSAASEMFLNINLPPYSAVGS